MDNILTLELFYRKDKFFFLSLRGNNGLKSMAIPYLYTDYGEFLNFLSKYKRFPSMRVLLALTVMGKKAGADVLTATTRRLIRPIAVRRKRLRSSWKKASAFSDESIRI